MGTDLKWAQGRNWSAGARLGGAGLSVFFCSKIPPSFEHYREFVETRPPEVIANIALCLIHQANYLIDQQLRRLDKDFLAQEGLRERMTRMRLSARNKR